MSRKAGMLLHEGEHDFHELHRMPQSVGERRQQKNYCGTLNSSCWRPRCQHDLASAVDPVGDSIEQFAWNDRASIRRECADETRRARPFCAHLTIASKLPFRRPRIHAKVDLHTPVESSRYRPNCGPLGASVDSLCDLIPPATPFHLIVLDQDLENQTYACT